MRTYWRRATKRIALGLLQFALVVFLIYIRRYGVLDVLVIVSAILLATSGAISYFSGCFALCKARGVGQAGVVALIALCLLSVPIGVLLAPPGLLLIPLFLILALLVAPITGFARPAKTRDDELRRG